MECHEWIELGMKRELASEADPRVLRWFGHVEIVLKYLFIKCGVKINAISGGHSHLGLWRPLAPWTLAATGIREFESEPVQLL